MRAVLRVRGRRTGTAVVLAAVLLGFRTALAATVIDVYVVNYPLKYFAQRIGGDRVSVTLPVPRGRDPAFWAPRPEIVAGYQAADLILLNGAAYARWTATATLPPSRLVDTSRTFADRLIPAGAVTHSHGLEGAHAHGDLAFTTWLDLDQAAAQARAVLHALSRRAPAHEAEFERRFRALAAELGELDARLLSAAQGGGDGPLLASHPVYQYLARRYGLNLQSLHWEPSQVPAEQEWAQLEALLESHPARWMIWEDEPDPRSARRLAALGIRSLVFSPCAGEPARGDFLTVMRANVEALLAALR
jgi:zinc transport system substrate-binding protein